MLVIDDDVSQVVIRQTGLDTVVGEDGTTDSYTVELSAAPAATVEVRIAANSDVCLSTAADAERRLRRARAHASRRRAWGPITVTVKAKADGIVESFEYARLEHTVGGAVVGVVTAFVTDRDVPDVLITESDGATQVAEGIGLQDSYTVVLTSDPGAETVTVTATSLPTITQYDPEDGTPRITRTERAGRAEHRRRRDLAHLRRARVHHRQLEYGEDRAGAGGRGRRDRRSHPAGVPGPGAAGARDPGLAVRRRRRLRLRLPARELPAGAAAGRDQLPARRSRRTRRSTWSRATPVDRLIVNNQDDVADRSMTLTSEAVTGLGMSAAGIAYDDFEALDILLGSGIDDVLVVDDPHRDDDDRDRRGRRHRRRASRSPATPASCSGTATTRPRSPTAACSPASTPSCWSPAEPARDTTIVDDTADSEDDLGTLTQTSLVGLDMVSTQPNNLFSLELGAGLTGVQLHVVAHRPATPDAPALDIDVTLTLTAAQLAGLTAETLAALLQAALFPPVANAAAGRRRSRETTTGSPRPAAVPTARPASSTAAARAACSCGPPAACS